MMNNTMNTTRGFDLTTTNEDWVALKWGDCQLVPVRIVVDLPQQGEVNVLAAWDCDYWMIVSAVGVGDDEPVQLSQAEKDLISDKLDQQREDDAREY